jgi:hypothetical protein
MGEITVMDLDGYWQMTTAKKRHKHNARKVYADGYTFDSEAEYRHYCYLYHRQLAGEIGMLEVHPTYVLQPAHKHRGRKLAAVTFTPDFRYVEDGHTVVCDVKGQKTTDYNLRVRMFLPTLADNEWFEEVDAGIYHGRRPRKWHGKRR